MTRATDARQDVLAGTNRPKSSVQSPPSTAHRPPSTLSVLVNLWRHRRLLWQFTVRNVELRHKGSHLGLVWSFLNPLLLLALYVFVFGYIFGGRFHAEGEESRIEYGMIVFLGLAIYHFVAEVISTSHALVVGNPNFVKKVVFPLEILPASAVGTAVFHFGITLGLVFIGAWLAGLNITASALWLPVILVPMVAMALGAALLLSALGVFWRDVGHVMQFVLLALMFASAVFYPISKIPPEAWAILKFNPVIHLINEARNVTFWGSAPSTMHLAYLYACGLVALLIGSAAFQRLRGSFADVL